MRIARSREIDASLRHAILHEMWLCVAVCRDVLAEVSFARLQFPFGQFAAEQLVAKPNSVGVEDVGLAVVGDIAYPPVTVILRYIRTVDAIGLAGAVP
jgi:hypothetical protein